MLYLLYNVPLGRKELRHAADPCSHCYVAASVFVHSKSISRILTSVQYQTFACIHWLCHFGVLSIIPLHGSVPYSEVAMVAGVPVTQLRSIARMAMTGNFLSEPVPDQVAHNTTSGIFVTNPSINGWALFMAENSCPGALAMVRATEKYGATDKKNETAFNIARSTDLPFFDYIGQSPERGKQFAAYMKNVLASEGTKVDHLVNGFDWASLGESTVVDVSQLSSRITMQAPILL